MYDRQIFVPLYMTCIFDFASSGRYPLHGAIYGGRSGTDVHLEVGILSLPKELFWILLLWIEPDV